MTDPASTYRAAVEGITALEQAVATTKAEIDAVRADHTRTADYRQQRVRELSDQLTERVRADRERISQRLAQADDTAHTVLAGRTDDPVAESRKARAAGRVNRLIDAGRAPLDIAATFAEAKDLDALRALRDEIPSVVAAATDNPEERRTSTHRLTVAIDQTMAPLLTKTEARAAEVRANVQTARELLDSLSVYATQPNGGRSRIAFALARRPEVKL
ncbi:hypothetical protein ACI8AC_23730 [Geodermatophilus sp. SYSU D00758]